MKINRLKINQLKHEIERDLWEDWDPIGLNDCDGPTDENKGYVPSVYKKLTETADKLKIAETLYHHANINMGLSIKLEDHFPAAEKLLKISNGHSS